MALIKMVKRSTRSDSYPEIKGSAVAGFWVWKLNAVAGIIAKAIKQSILRDVYVFLRADVAPKESLIESLFFASLAASMRKGTSKKAFCSTNPSSKGMTSIWPLRANRKELTFGCSWYL